jgi:hypothetical protein
MKCNTKNSQKACFQNRLKITLAKKATFCFLAISMILGASLFTIPSALALPSIVIKPIYVDFKFHEKPTICIFGSDKGAINVGIDSITEWRDKLRSYTRNSGWDMTVTVNPQDISSCSTEIHFVKKPALFSDVTDAQGVTMFQADRAIVEIYTTQYYEPAAFKLVKDNSNKERPVAGQYADVPLSHLKSVTEHELGHVFGLSHQKDNSIMVTGYVISHISNKDCQLVVAKYGEDWPSIASFIKKIHYD